MTRPAIRPLGRPLWPAYGALLVLAVLAIRFELGDSLSHPLYDHQTRVLRSIRPVDVDDNFLIVGVDQETLETYPAPLALWHERFGELFRRLATLGASLIVWDIVLPDRSVAFVSPDYDRALLSGVLAAKRRSAIVLARTADRDGRLRTLFPPLASIVGDDGIGLALVPADADGAVRRLEAYIDGVPTLFGRTAAALELDAADAFYVNYALGAPLSYIPMHELLDGPNFPAVDGKVVYVGAVLDFEDRHPTPMGDMPGVFIQAQGLRSVLHRSAIERASKPVVVAVTLVVSLFFWVRYDAIRALLAFVMALAALYGVALTAMAYNLFVPMFVPAAIAFGSIGSRFTWESSVSFLERRRFEASFGRYVSPDVLTEVLQGHLDERTRPQRRTVCILFSDIRGFTSRSETQSPEAVVALLNEYFEEMVSAVHARGGTIDKFIGDGLMAFFGAPADRSNPAADGLEAAGEMLERLDRLNDRLLARGEAALTIGIGLHVGEVVLGHVGSKSRHEYTVIGDTVNTASRLEGLTKTLDYPVICSDELASRVGPRAGLTYIGPQSIRGRASVDVHGWRPES